jgi:signal peptidase I
MEPTLPKGTRFTAAKVQPGDLRRGDIVIVNNGVQDWVIRLVGLPGDRVAMVDGGMVLNGEAVPRRRAGSHSIEDEFESREYAVFSERLPGEARPHRVLDAGPAPLDNTPEVALGEDEYFLLGDNRDNSADSRMAGSSFGLGIVSGAQIERRAELD